MIEKIITFLLLVLFVMTIFLLGLCVYWIFTEPMYGCCPKCGKKLEQFEFCNSYNWKQSI